MDNEAIYDLNWNDWQDFKEIGPMSRHARRLVFNEIKRLKFRTVLDVGCGPGIFLRELVGWYPEAVVSGVDVSGGGLEIARQKVPRGDFFKLDVTQSSPRGRYDLITLVDVAEHLERDLAAFKNLCPVCTGHMIILTLEGRMREFEPEVGHVRNYAPGELNNKLEQAGFEIVRYRHWGWPVYSPLYRNMSGPIAAHKTEMTPLRSLMGRLFYYVLMCNWPDKGDLITVVARPR